MTIPLEYKMFKTEVLRKIQTNVFDFELYVSMTTFFLPNPTLQSTNSVWKVLIIFVWKESQIEYLVFNPCVSFLISNWPFHTSCP